jgi:hypothetical protein
VPVALVIQHAKSMIHIRLSYVVYLAVAYFYTLSHTRHDFQEGKKVTEYNKIWFFIFSSNFFQIFLILRIFKQDIMTKVNSYLCKVLNLISYFNQTYIFLIDFQNKNTQIPWKILPLGPRFVPCERTDRKDRQPGRHD